MVGDLDHVAAALQHLQAACQSIDLSLNLGKYELAVVGSMPEAILSAHFPPMVLQTADGAGRVLTNFDFFGAAIGNESFIRDHTADRAAKAGDLLDGFAELTDPQVGLCLLRACGGYIWLIHSMHYNPPRFQSLALNMFDGMVRRCFGGFTGMHPSVA